LQWAILNNYWMAFIQQIAANFAQNTAKYRKIPYKLP
jgi:hypothetical protein